MELRKQLETKGNVIVIEQWKEHEFWPCIAKFKYQPLTKHDAKIIIESMIKSYNKIYNGEIEQYVKEMWQELYNEWEFCRNRPKKEKEKKLQQGWVYILKLEDDKTKIGLSKNPEKRKKEIICNSCYSADDIGCFITYKTKDMNYLESLIHNEFEDNHLNKEWFILNDKEIEMCKNCNFKQEILDLIQEVKIQCQKSN